MDGTGGRDGAGGMDGTDGRNAVGPLLAREFLARPPIEVGPELLGGVLHSTIGGAPVDIRITEVEAYSGATDPGSHAYRGRTARNQVMFGPPGHLYVYFTYGMHFCGNVVCGSEGSASGLLLRAGEVIAGHPIARSRRMLPSGVPARDRDLARGPARLAAALGISREHGGINLLDPASPITLHAPATDSRGTRQVRSGPRVGVRGPGGDGSTFPWRFWIDGDPTVSPYRPAAPLRGGGA